MKNPLKPLASGCLWLINYIGGAVALMLATLLFPGPIAALLVHTGLWLGTPYGLAAGCGLALVVMLVGCGCWGVAVFGWGKKAEA